MRSRLGAARLTAYADGCNLLDFTNTIAVFAETRETTDDLHREEVVSSEVARASSRTRACG